MLPKVASDQRVLFSPAADLGFRVELRDLRLEGFPMHLEAVPIGFGSEHALNSMKRNGNLIHHCEAMRILQQFQASMLAGISTRKGHQMSSWLKSSSWLGTGEEFSYLRSHVV